MYPKPENKVLYFVPLGIPPVASWPCSKTLCQWSETVVVLCWAVCASCTQGISETKPGGEGFP